MSEWISVKDRLPDDDRAVLVYSPSEDYAKPFISVGWYTPGKGFGLVPSCWRITHWMPLPEPPKDIA